MKQLAIFFAVTAMVAAQTVNVETPVSVCSITQTAACLLTPADYQAFGQKLSPTSLIPWAQLTGVPVATNLVDGILSHQMFQAFAGRQTNLGFVPENTTNKTIPGGYAGLGSDGLVLPAELPPPMPGPAGPTGTAAFTLVAADGTPLALTGAVGPVPVGGCALSATDGMWHCQDTMGVEGTQVKWGAPTTSSDTCTPPQIMQDDTSIYVCTAANQWKKAALNSY
jgi:hypothetical protein